LESWSVYAAPYVHFGLHRLDVFGEPNLVDSEMIGFVRRVTVYDEWQHSVALYRDGIVTRIDFRDSPIQVEEWLCKITRNVVGGYVNFYVFDLTENVTVVDYNLTVSSFPELNYFGAHQRVVDFTARWEQGRLVDRIVVRRFVLVEPSHGVWFGLESFGVVGYGFGVALVMLLVAVVLAFYFSGRGRIRW